MAANPAAIALTESRLASYNVHTATHQRLGNHEVTTHNLIPKTTEPGTQPLIVRFHSGFLITGCSLFPAFLPSWILNYASAHSAIIVSPKYLKLPESRWLEIMNNLRNFWHYIRYDLQTIVADTTDKDIHIDLTKALTLGNSASGYLAIQSALIQHVGEIKAVIAANPVLDRRLYSADPCCLPH